MSIRQYFTCNITKPTMIFKGPIILKDAIKCTAMISSRLLPMRRTTKLWRVRWSCDQQFNRVHVGFLEVLQFPQKMWITQMGMWMLTRMICISFTKNWFVKVVQKNKVEIQTKQFYQCITIVTAETDTNETGRVYPTTAAHACQVYSYSNMCIGHKIHVCSHGMVHM